MNKVSLWKGVKPFLVHLDIELTERCNNNCVHCYINLHRDDLVAKHKELSTDEIKGILREAAELGCLTVRFTGGEPLLREDFEEIYIFTRKLGLRVMLFTNARLVTPHLAGFFSRMPSLEKIEVSVYGMEKRSYEQVSRAHSSFKSAWRGINLLLKNKVPFVVKGALLPANRNEIERFEKWAGAIPGMDKPPSYAMFFDLSCRRDEKRNKFIRSLRVSPEEGLKFLTRRKDEYLKDRKEFCAKFMKPSGDKLFACGAGLGGGCVNAYGYFQPCMMLRHPNAMYNLKKGALKHALTDFFPKLRKIKAKNPEYLTRCGKCFLKGLCEQCPAKSWSEHGTLDTPVEYLCQIAHKQAIFLGLIKDQEKAWKAIDWKNRVNSFVKKSNETLKS